MRTDYFDHVTVATYDGVPHGTYALCRSVRKSYPEINFEVHLVPDGPGHHFNNPAPVFGKNAIPERLYRHIGLFRIEPKQRIDFSRPIHELPTAHIPGPTAAMTQPLAFGQIGFAASQLPFRFPCSRYIHHRPNKLDTARRISRTARHGMEVFDCAIRHQQSIFVIEVISVDGSTVNGPLHGGAVFRMGALDNKFQGRFCRSVNLKNTVGFVRPDDFSVGNIPSEAPGAAQSLRFGQIHFALQQRGFKPLLILYRYFEAIAGTLDSFCGFSLRRNRECNKERCNAKQDQTRHLRNTHGE